jgi:hypothetical protein
MMRFFRRRKKGRQPPSKIDVKNNFHHPAISAAAGATAATSATNAPPSSGGRRRNHGDDGVSAMTPATGMPPDDAPLLRPLLGGISPHRRDDGYDRDDEYDDRPQSRLPSGGGSLCFDRICINDALCDDISTVTGAMPSPERKKGGGHGGGRVTNLHGTNVTTLVDGDIPLPGEDDDEDDRPTVYEEDSGGSSHDDAPPANPAVRGRVADARGRLVSNGVGAERVTSPSSSSSWLTNTRYFQRAIDAAFDGIDVDKSGDVTLEELYSGLLLIHLQMAAYVGASACRVRPFFSPFIIVFLCFSSLHVHPLYSCSAKCIILAHRLA